MVVLGTVQLESKSVSLHSGVVVGSGVVDVDVVVLVVVVISWEQLVLMS